MKKNGGGAERKADPLRNGAWCWGAWPRCGLLCLSAGGVGGHFRRTGREELMYQLTIVGCVLGAFAGGLLAVRRCGSRALIVGLTTGGVLFLAAAYHRGALLRTVSLEAGGIGLLCGSLCGGAAAGILGGGGKKKPARKKRRK